MNDYERNPDYWLATKLKFLTSCQSFSSWAGRVKLSNLSFFFLSEIFHFKKKRFFKTIIGFFEGLARGQYLGAARFWATVKQDIAQLVFLFVLFVFAFFLNSPTSSSSLATTWLTFFQSKRSFFVLAADFGGPFEAQGDVLEPKKLFSILFPFFAFFWFQSSFF